MATTKVDSNSALLLELGQVRGQLMALTQMIQNNHDSSNKRLDDMRHAMETRIAGAEGRIATLEKNERSTAIKAGAAGVVSSLIVTAAAQSIKGLFGGH